MVPAAPVATSRRATPAMAVLEELVVRVAPEDPDSLQVTNPMAQTVATVATARTAVSEEAQPMAERPAVAVPVVPEDPVDQVVLRPAAV